MNAAYAPGDAVDAVQLGRQPALGGGRAGGAAIDGGGRRGGAPRRRGGQRVKAIGAGHSFTATAVTDGVQLSLDRMQRVLHVDHETQRVTVQGGIRLHRLNDELAAVGLAMPNLGDIDRQSIAGAIATATHGTGLGLGNLATTVVGMELVTGTGDVVRARRRAAARRPGRCRRARRSSPRSRCSACRRSTCTPARPSNRSTTSSTACSSTPPPSTTSSCTGCPAAAGAARSSATRAPTSRAGRSPRLAYVRDKWIGENLGFGLVCKVGRRFPRATPTIAKLVTGAAGERDLVDRSDRIFCTPRRVHFVEMEYGLPVEHLADAVRALRAATKRMPTPILFPIEVRVSAADDIPLSTGFGRPSGWIAVHQYRGAPYEEYFGVVERIMDEHGGRPHWGKLHGQRAATLQERYPQWADFQAARDRLDPGRTFANPYLERVLGP